MATALFRIYFQPMRVDVADHDGHGGITSRSDASGFKRKKFKANESSEIDAIGDFFWKLPDLDFVIVLETQFVMGKRFIFLDKKAPCDQITQFSICELRVNPRAVDTSKHASFLVGRHRDMRLSSERDLRMLVEADPGLRFGTLKAATAVFVKFGHFQFPFLLDCFADFEFDVVVDAAACDRLQFPAINKVEYGVEAGRLVVQKGDE